MTITAKQPPQNGQEIVIYSERNYRRGDVEIVRDERGNLLGQAVCCGNFGNDPKYTHTDQNGKVYPYGRKYHKFTFRNKKT